MHVDLLVNEWEAGHQSLLVRIVDTGGQLVATGSPVWTDRLSVFANLQEVSDEYHGTYLDATQPHEDDACDFRDTSSVRLMKVTRP